MNQFDKDLEEKGKPCELAVLAHIKKWDANAYIVDGFDSAKDIVSPLTGKTFEVKNCQDAMKDVPIEISIKNKKGKHLSGLSVSSSTYWVIFCLKRYFMISTDKLREIIADRPAKEYEIHDQIVTLKILPILLLETNSKHIWNE